MGRESVKYWFAFKVFRKYKHTVTKDSSGLLYWKGAGCGGKVPKLRINIFKLCVLKDRIFPPIKTCRGYLEPGAPCAYILHDSLKIFSYTTAAPLFLKWFFLPMPPTEFMNFQVAQRFSSGILSTTIELTLLNSHFYALLWEQNPALISILYKAENSFTGMVGGNDLQRIDVCK